MKIQQTNQYSNSKVNFGMHIEAKGNLLKNITPAIEDQISNLNSWYGRMEPLNQNIEIDVKNLQKHKQHLFTLKTVDKDKGNQIIEDTILMKDGLFDKNKTYALPYYKIENFLKKIHKKLYFDRSLCGIQQNARMNEIRLENRRKGW